MDGRIIARLADRLERVADRQHQHEQKCAERNERDAGRFGRLETAVSRNTKLLWAIVLGIVGLALQAWGGAILP